VLAWLGFGWCCCWLDFGLVGLGCFGRLFNFGWLIVLAGCLVFEKVFHWVFVWANVFYIPLSVGLPGHFHTIGWLDGKYLHRKIFRRRNSYGICIFLGRHVEINAGIH
jgi:hypothetical protein